MSGYETLLFIHVIGAFAIVTGLACITPLVLNATVEEPASSRLEATGNWMMRIGALLTLVFGLWLVVDREYRFFKLWIVGALALLILAAGAGEKATSADGNRTFYWAAVAAVAAVLVLMIFKPGV